MAGNLVVDTLQLDTGTSTFRILSNTGATILSANAGGLQTGIAANTITFNMLSPDLLATQNNLYNVVTSNANTSTGNTSVTFTSNTGTINVGMVVYGAGFGRGTTVSSVVNANTIVLSTAAANNSTNTRLSFVEPNKLVTSDEVAPGLCKAWVNFNGTGTVAIRAAFNVSSITDNGTGIYTVNFTQALPDTNFTMLATSGALSPASGFSIAMGNATLTTSSVQIYTTNNVAANADQAFVGVAIFR